MPSDPYSLDLAAWETERDLARGAVPFDQVDRVSGLLADYNERVRAEGRGRFSALDAERQAEANRVRALFTQPDHGLDAQARAALDDITARSVNPDADKKQIFNTRFLAGYYGAPVETVSAQYPLFRSDFARKELGDEKAGDEAVFNRIAETYRTDDSLVDAVTRGARGRLPYAVEFAKWQAAQKQAGTWNESKAADYLARGRERFDAVRSIADRVRLEASQIVALAQNATTDADLAPALPMLRGKSDQELAVMWGLMLDQAGEKAATDKGIGEQTADTLARSMRDVLTKAARAMDRAAITDAKNRLEGGAVVPHEVAARGARAVADYLVSEAQARTASQAAAGFAGGAEAFVPDSRSMRDLTQDERNAVKAALDQDIADTRTLRKLQEFADQSLDPVTGSNWFTRRFYYPALESAGVMAASMLPGGVGVVGNVLAYADDEYNRLRDLGASHEGASVSSLIVGGLQGAADMVQAELLIGKLPGFNAALKRIVGAPGGNMAARVAGYTAANVAGETGIELLQDHIIPALVQDLTQTGGDVTWLAKDGPLINAARSAPETAAAMLLLGLVGAGAATWRDVNLSREFVTNSENLVAAGLSRAQALEVASLAQTDMEGAQARLRALWTQRAGTQATMQEAAQRVADAAREQRRAISAMEGTGALPVMARTAEGWRLTFADGQAVDYGTHEAADKDRWQYARDNQIAAHEATRAAIAQMERNAEAGREFSYEFAPGEMSLRAAVEAGIVSEGQAQERVDIAQRADADYDAAMLSAQASGATPQDRLALHTILGSSRTDFRDGIMRTTIRLYQGATPLTVIEEKLESDARALLAGQGGREWMTTALRDYERASGDRLLPTAGALSDQQLVEAWSHLGQSYFVARSKKGGDGLAKGWEGKGLRNAIAQALRSKMGAVLEGYSALFRAVFRTAAKLARLRREKGLSPELEAELAKSLGFSDQMLHDRAVVDEAANMAAGITDEAGIVYRPPSAEDEANGITFSVARRDAEYMDAVKRGDMEKAQRMVDEAAGAAGYVSAVKHGTHNDFSIFDTSKGRNQGNRFEMNNWGIWTTDDDASIYGPKVLKLYGKSSSPLRVQNFEEWFDDYVKHAYPSFYFKGITADELAESLRDEAGAYFKRKKDIPLGIVGTKEYRQMLAGQPGATGYVKSLKERGFDSVLMEGGFLDGQLQTVRIYLDSNQLKSADPVTYDDAGNVIPLSQRFNPERPEITFSLARGSLDAQLSAMFDPFQRSPELRRKLGLEMQRRAADVGRVWSNLHALNRTKEDLDREQRALVKRRRAELVEQGLATLSPETQAALYGDTALADAREHPVIKEMIVRDGKAIGGWRGRLRSYSQADEKTQNEYDDMPEGLPRWMFGGTMAPDQLAQELYDNGLINDPTAPAMWREVERAFKSAEDLRVAFRDARNAAREIESKAKAQAKREGEAWREIQDHMKPSDRERLVAAIRTLDAVIAALPPDLRGRVGGYARMAELSTDAARLRHVQTRVEKIDKLLETWLRKEFRGAIEDLFEKSRPDRTAGAKEKGKLGADAHALIDAAEAASAMDATRLAGALADVDARLADPDITAEDSALLTRQRELMALAGHMKHADAARLSAAFEALEFTRGEGYAQWKMMLIERREAREAAREALKAGTGSTGARIERDNQREAAANLLGKLAAKGRDIMLSLSSFHEVMRFAFGDSATVTEIVDRERVASAQKEDATQSLADDITGLFTRLAGSEAAGERLRYDLGQISIRTAKANLSQLEAITAILMWRQEDGQRHMIGALDEDGKPAGEWHYDQAWVDEVTEQLRPEARAVLDFIADRYAGEWERLNPLYRERHGVNLPSNNNYAPITVAPSQAKAGQMVDPVSGAVVSGSILTPGSLRTRSQSAVAEPRFGDALQTLIAHTAQMEHWMAYYDLAVDLHSMLGNRELTNAVEGAAGEKASKVLRQWADVFAQGGVRDASALLATSETLNKMAGRAASMALIGRVSTLLIQSTQLAAASVQMPAGAYLSRMARLLSGRLAWGDAIRSDYIQRRLRQMPPLVRQAMEGLASQHKPNLIKHFTQRVGQLVAGADALFTGGTYAILLDYHRANAARLGMSGADAEAWAHNEAERATDEVAQPTRMGARSLAEITATNPLSKVVWAFASESRQKLMIMAWAARNARQHKARFGKAAFLTFVVGGFGAQILRNAWREAKGDDDERMWSVERLAFATLTGPVSGLPGWDAMAGKGGLFDPASRVSGAANRLIFDDAQENDRAWRDARSVLWGAGLFSDTAAAVSALANAGEDFAKVIDNLFNE